jgi:type IV secretory pathway VirB2 component (pilin)
VFLGVIALATMVMAIILVGAMVAASRLARRLNRLADHLERELKPIFGHLNAMARDASRAAALATVQIERADRLIAEMAQKVEHTLNVLQNTFEGPAREGRALFAALRAGFRAVRGLRDGSRGRRARSEDEDALFI